MTAFAVTGYSLAYRETVYRMGRELKERKYFWLPVVLGIAIALAVLMLPNSIEDGTIQAIEPSPPTQTEMLPVSPFDFLV